MILSEEDVESVVMMQEMESHCRMLYPNCTMLPVPGNGNYWLLP